MMASMMIMVMINKMPMRITKIAKVIIMISMIVMKDVDIVDDTHPDDVEESADDERGKGDDNYDAVYLHQRQCAFADHDDCCDDVETDGIFDDYDVAMMMMRMILMMMMMLLMTMMLMMVLMMVLTRLLW